MEENYVTIIVSKKTEQMYRQAVDALGKAYEAFERASSVFVSDRSDDGSAVIQSIDLIKEARATRDRCAVALAEEIAEDIKANELGMRKPLSRAEKARRGAEYLKNKIQAIRDFGHEDVELKA